MAQQTVIYTHFFYVPVILSALWWEYQFFWVAFFLSAALIIPDLVIGNRSFLYQNLIRSFMFFLIGFVVAYHRVRIRKSNALSKYRDILSSIKEPVTIINSSCNFLMSNSKFNELFPDAKTINFFKDIIEDLNESKVFFDAIFESFTGKGGSLPVTIKTPEYGERFFEINLYPLITGERVESVILTMWDMTSFRESEKVKHVFNERQSLIIHVLELLNRHGGEPYIIREILKLINLHTGLDLLLLFIRGKDGFSLYEYSPEDESFGSLMEKECPLLNKVLASGDLYYPCHEVENFSFSGNSYYCSELKSPEDYSDTCLCLKKGNYLSKAVVPFYVAGNTPGFFMCFSRDKNFFDDEMLNFLHGLVQSVAMAIERRNNEINLKQTIVEKEHLIKEVHHRVKNNMQIITSLISLQAARQKDEAIRSVLNDCQNRVRIMALIQEKLYNSENFSSINFNSYMHSLVPIVLSSFKVDRTRIKVNLDVSDITFNIATAIPLAQLINELFTNSLKHAFPDNRSGVIDISLFSSPSATEYLLSFSDNGVGLPEGVSFPDKGNLGFQLIDAFIKQLRGKYILSLNNGVSFFISFSSLK